MKRVHIHVSVDDLDASIGFYATLFDTPPTVTKADYAKWSLEDPRLNFAISRRGAATGLDHVGIEVSDSAELAKLATRLKAAGQDTFDQQATSCCYALSNKTWVVDPSGIRWETFHTFGEATTYGEEPVLPAQATQQQSTSACCG